MKPNGAVLWIGAGLIALLFLRAKTANLDLNGLISMGYDPGDVQRLQSLYNVLIDAGLTDQQILFMLSQSLVETGLFTSNPNYNLMDNYNNYAGITGNSYFSAGPSGFAKYPTLTDFVNDWKRVLSFGANPLGATNLTDFNNRLVRNSYYGSDNANTYLNNMTSYYNLLSNL